MGARLVPDTREAFQPQSETTANGWADRSPTRRDDPSGAPVDCLRGV